MIVFENCGWEIDSVGVLPFGSGDSTVSRQWEVPDDSEVAAKIMSATRPWTPVEDENDDLVDIIETPLSQDELNQQRADEIKCQLAELDNQTTRPLRAILTGTSTDEDTDKLREIEAQAALLRTELAELEGGE